MAGARIVGIRVESAFEGPRIVVHDKTRRARLRIEGRVQGVFFRESARREAERLGVRGWVRNLDDGAVEALAEGEASAMDSFVAWCHHGPRAARVDRVAVSEEAATGDLTSFTVER